MLKDRKHELFSLKIDFSSFRFFLYCSLILVLQFLNWFFEALKFYVLFHSSERISLFSSLKAVYAGNFTAFFTPDRMGTFIGRIGVLQKHSKLKITALTAIGNLSQLMATVFFGFMAFLTLSLQSHSLLEIDFNQLLFLQGLFLLLFFSLIVLFVYPYSFLMLFKRWPIVGGFIERLVYVKEISGSVKLKIIVVSLLRFLVFYLQYFLLVNFFQIDFSFVDVLIFVGVLYGLVTFIPSPFLGNFGTREALALYLSSATPLGLIGPLISLLVWFVNVGFSALIGGVVLLFIKYKLS